MRLEIRSFRTKVAKRIFLLFVLCSLLPVTALAVVSFLQVRGQLMSQSQARLREENKAVAVSVYERLLFLRSEMRTLATLLSAGGGEPLAAYMAAAGQETKTHLKNLALVRPDRVEGVVGEMPPFPDIDSKEQEHVKKGQALLALEKQEGGALKMFLVLEVSPDRPEAGRLIGEIDPVYLWEAAERRPPGTEVFILGKGKEILFSSLPADATFVAQNFRGVGQAHSGLFDYDDGELSIASYTSIFLSTNFFYDSWAVVLSEPSSQIFAPMASFKIVFPVLVVLTLALVFILSVNLIHKNLGPMELLQEATKKIAQGIYGHRVDIESGDEFEELGRSFNNMSAKIAESQNLLVRTAKMATMGQMAAGFVHEIKQPLSAIHGHLQLFSLVPELPEEDQKRLAVTTDAVERINGILTRFSTFAHMGEGQLETLSLFDSIERVRRLLEHQFMRRVISCTVDCAPALPPIVGDSHGLQQVISNLLINAMDALEEKKEEENRRILIKVRAEGDRVVFQVEDNGCGMPADIVPKIFDPFFTTKEPGKGTGLGMAIIEAILLRHGATIEVESRVGEGTLFTIRFPAAKEAA